MVNKIEDLENMRNELERCVDEVKLRAVSINVSPFKLMDATGRFILLDALVALSRLEVIILELKRASWI